MRVQPTGNQNNKQDVFSRKRSPLPTILIGLIALVIGGCLALLMVNRLLINQHDLYMTYQSMAEANAIFDFTEDLLVLYLLCGSMLLLLFLGTFALWAWKRTKSRFLRVVSVILILLAFTAIVYIWLLGATNGPVMPQLPQTPTPLPG